jgi:hypothetical protein
VRSDSVVNYSMIPNSTRGVQVQVPLALDRGGGERDDPEVMLDRAGTTGPKELPTLYSSNVASS